MKKQICHWQSYAKAWDGQDLPLRPTELDMANYRQLSGRVFNQFEPSRTVALILGVTPELEELAAASHQQVYCVDSSMQMITNVWTGGYDSAMQADWAILPIANGVVDTVYCDGGLHLMPPRQLCIAIAEISRVLNSQGRLIARLFLPPEWAEPLTAVHQRFLNNDARSINWLKVWLWHAIEINTQAEAGVCLADIWQVLEQWSAGKEVDHWLTDLGLTDQQIATVKIYRDNPTHYYFTDAVKLAELMARHGNFAVEARLNPQYQQGSQFPVIAYVKN